MIVGNKCDLSDLRQVDTTEAKEFAEKKGFLFMGKYYYSLIYKRNFCTRRFKCRVSIYGFI
jgi:hypothetical protein